MGRDHSPVLYRLELRPQRRRLELNQRVRTLQIRALPLGHVVKFEKARASEYRCPCHPTNARLVGSIARRAGIEPATSRFGVGDSSTEELPARVFQTAGPTRESQMRREGLEPP